ncbi:39S ribosomal protein L16, mitochondrial [Tribolium madens]|uniref:39S ribosomal protein L16, mitochondrial n=1 Tax=Tribolium madens TaxID=41895 RepID=UPI001CF75542|nr:39S ribosomal protein L16, mitochondrial [Tribolium madens]
MNLQKLILFRAPSVHILQSCGMKHFPPPPNYDHIQIPERPKLRFMDKVPFIPPGTKAPKMQKKLRLMRGPETVHNFLIHQQYGIVALGGGRLKWPHFEMMRLAIGRKIDPDRMFAIWRVDAPWQPVTKKGQGQRMGGGKGAIDHYVTPIKAGRVILEVGGKCEFEEVKGFLHDIAMKMPFQAMAVSHEMLKERKEKEKWEEENNQNYYTMKYCMQNNMGGCHKWMSPFDYKFLGKYL